MISWYFVSNILFSHSFVSRSVPSTQKWDSLQPSAAHLEARWSDNQVWGLVRRIILKILYGGIRWYEMVLACTGLFLMKTCDILWRIYVNFGLFSNFSLDFRWFQWLLERQTCWWMSIVLSCMIACEIWNLVSLFWFDLQIQCFDVLQSPISMLCMFANFSTEPELTKRTPQICNWM